MLRNSLPEHVENSIHKRLKISANHIREKHTDDRKMTYREEHTDDWEMI